MPIPGDFAVVATPGLMAMLIRLATRSKVNHAFLLVAPGRIIEANPGGAAESDLANYDGMYQVRSAMDLSPTMRAAIVDAAQGHLGDPYSWLDDAAIGLTDLFRWHVPAWVRARLARSDRLQCAQLVDQCYLEAGIHLWDDGRPPGMVAPSDLLLLIQGAKV
jgi:hypothetical protein